MLLDALLKPPFLLLRVVGEEILLASDWDFVTPGPGCKQLSGTVGKGTTFTFSFTFVFAFDRSQH